jgi:hypothetical protein
MSIRERQISALEVAVDDVRYLKATRPSGMKWEDHREWYLEFDPDDSEATQYAAIQALQDWYDAQHHFRHDSDDRCGQCDLLLGEDMVLQEDGSYFCQDCDVSLEVG